MGHSDNQLTLTIDRASVVTICRALKLFYDDLYSGDQAGRILRARADYIRSFLEDALEDSGVAVEKEE